MIRKSLWVVVFLVVNCNLFAQESNLKETVSKRTQFLFNQPSRLTTVYILRKLISIKGN